MMTNLQFLKLILEGIGFTSSDLRNLEITRNVSIILFDNICMQTVEPSITLEQI